MTAFLFTLALGLALADWRAVAREQRQLEYLFKPATLVVILMGAWSLTQDAHDGWLAVWFLLGLFGSLLGDIFLMLPHNRFFLQGLVAFLLAHLAYIIGLNPTLPPLSSLVLIPLIAIVAIPIARQLIMGLRRSGRASLVAPVALYVVVISVMLFSAVATWFRVEWTTLRAALVSVGATLFYISDAVLGWNQFVKPFAAARVIVMATYHLAQLALALTIAT
jgi:uncharacterized membrane protein YhhN